MVNAMRPVTFVASIVCTSSLRRRLGGWAAVCARGRRKGQAGHAHVVAPRSVHAEGKASVVNEDVGLYVFNGQLRHHVLDPLDVLHVEGQAERLRHRWVRLCERGVQRIEPLVPPADEHDPRAAFGEPPRARLADARSCARDPHRRARDGFGRIQLRLHCHVARRNYSTQ